MPRTPKSFLRFERQFSSGGIVFRKQPKGLQVVLISRQGGKIWCLPKGHIEKGESSQEAALREVQEETGLTGRLIQKIGDVSYWYHSKEEGKRFFKKVSFYLIQHTGGDTRHHDFEVDEVAWLPLEKAILKLRYPNERRLMEKAWASLRRRRI